MTFTILEHPSDVGIEATGDSLKDAFEQAAHALMAVILEITPGPAGEERVIALRCDDREQLLVRWLSEILYLYDAQGFVASEITVGDLSSRHLTARIRGERFSPDRHLPRLDVKAVTYHQLLVEGTPAGARVRVFLDI